MIAKVTSPADNGLPIKSIIFPIILPPNIEDDEWEKDCWITCIEISPGAKNSIKGKPKTSPLTSPKAIDITIKNRIPVNIGPNIVCPDTIKNRKVSFLYKEQKPIQFINPNLLFPILYLLFNSTINIILNNLKKLLGNKIICLFKK